jgi:hypothetical protein
VITIEGIWGEEGLVVRATQKDGELVGDPVFVAYLENLAKEYPSGVHLHPEDPPWLPGTEESVIGFAYHLLDEVTMVERS